MDYNETLGTGINEWYMKQGNLIMPPDSNARIQHYWDWENYLMDKICPMLPTFAPNFYEAYWDTLEGYNISKGILQSWGNMHWESSHQGQLNTDEFVISDYPWSDLNPLFQDDTSSKKISDAIMDSLIYYDNDLSIHPHLAESYTFINDTTIEIVCREGIKWQSDYEGNFTNEFFDAEDIYFTLYSWATVSNDVAKYDWIKKMEIVDEMTIKLYIDGDPSTQQSDPFAPALTYLATKILPEHYLNQTQLADGVTPDITHASWNTFATHCFGTGLFELGTFTEGVETELDVFDSCWLLDVTVDKTNMDFVNRFGDFSNIMDKLRIKIPSNDLIRLNLFTSGRLDHYDFNDLHSFNYNTQGIEGISFQKELRYYLGFFGFNMRPVRPIIGNPEPCEDDPTITKGLAIRKAICYVTNREEINDIVHGGEYSIINCPIYERMGIWCNPNIIKYDHDFEMAKYYMELAGYDIPDYIYNLPTNTLWIYILAGISYGIGTGGVIFGFIFIRRKKSKKPIDNNLQTI